jgi:hypothetical protein
MYMALFDVCSACAVWMRSHIAVYVGEWARALHQGKEDLRRKVMEDNEREKNKITDFT